MSVVKVRRTINLAFDDHYNVDYDVCVILLVGYDNEVLG